MNDDWMAGDVVLVENARGEATTLVRIDRGGLWRCSRYACPQDHTDADVDVDLAHPSAVVLVRGGAIELERLLEQARTWAVHLEQENAVLTAEVAQWRDEAYQWITDPLAVRRALGAEPAPAPAPEDTVSRAHTCHCGAFVYGQDSPRGMRWYHGTPPLDGHRATVPGPAAPAPAPGGDGT